jgi:hypothetical protein
MASTPTFAAVHNYKYHDLPPGYNDYGPSAAPRFVSVSRLHHSREEEETTVAEDVGGSSGRTRVESLAFQWSKPREALGGGFLCNWRDRRVDSPKHALPSILMDTIVNHDRWDRLSCWWGIQKNKRTIPTKLSSSSPSSLPSPNVLRPN